MNERFTNSCKIRKLNSQDADVAIIDDIASTIDDIQSINNSYDQSLFDEDPFNFNSTVMESRVRIVNNKKVYDFHTPSASNTSPIKPALRIERETSLEKIFDIVISSNRVKCVPRVISWSIPNAIELIQGTVLQKAVYNEPVLWSMFEPAPPFLKMMKRFLADFLINVDRADPLESNQERTFFAETVVLWFRAFGAMTGLNFKWFENQNGDALKYQYYVKYPGNAPDKFSSYLEDDADV